MKVLVATSVAQGMRKNDYCWGIEGELVWIGMVCARDRRDPDGGCGCGRGFAGLQSQRATTTARVADLTMTVDEYTEALRAGLEAQGYGPDAVTAEDAQEMADVAATWRIGTVIERRLDTVQARAWPQPG